MQLKKKPNNQSQNIKPNEFKKDKKREERLYKA